MSRAKCSLSVSSTWESERETEKSQLLGSGVLVEGGPFSLWKNKLKLFGEYDDFRYENIGFDTPCFEGGAVFPMKKLTV